MSRLDIVLLSDELVEEWKKDGQMVGSRDFFYHCPICIKGNSSN